MFVYLDMFEWLNLSSLSGLGQIVQNCLLFVQKYFMLHSCLFVCFTFNFGFAANPSSERSEIPRYVCMCVFVLFVVRACVFACVCVYVCLLIFTL